MEQTEQIGHKWNEEEGKLQLWTKTTASTIVKMANGELFCYFAAPDKSINGTCFFYSLFILLLSICLFCSLHLTFRSLPFFTLQR